MKKGPGPIALFDSGVGGLSILREVQTLLPLEDLIFFADQAHVPYGQRTLEEVRRFSIGITEYLLKLEAKAIVVACNTASAAALHHLRQTFPDTPFVGMEPALKPAAALTKTNSVGVLATPATFQGELYASVVERFAEGVKVVEVVLPGLVEQIEAGDLDGPGTWDLLAEPLRSLQAAGVDTVVLACTHYPFVIPLIEEYLGPEVRVLDPAPAIARQTERVLAERGWLASSGRGQVTMTSSLDSEALVNAAQRLIGQSGHAQTAHWDATGELQAGS